MYCRKCGHEIDDDSRFCSYCREEVVQLPPMNDEPEKRKNFKKHAPLFFVIIAVGVLLIGLIVFLLAGSGKISEYKKGMELLDSGDYAEAQTIFETLGNYKDCEELTAECKYSIAMSLMSENNFKEAIAEFEELGDYKDSADKLKECNCYYSAEMSARLHTLEYGSTFVSLSNVNCSIDKSGSYYTVTARVLLQDESPLGYSFESYIDCVVVMVEDSEATSGFKVASWEADERHAVIDENIDYVESLKTYIKRNGGYDSEGNRSYLEVQKAANEYYYLFAEENGIGFWDFASYEGSRDFFRYSYECSFNKWGDATFDIYVCEGEMKNGKINYAGETTAVDTTGTIDRYAKDVKLGEIKNINYSEDKTPEFVLDAHDAAIECIEEVLAEARIGVWTFEELYGIEDKYA